MTRGFDVTLKWRAWYLAKRKTNGLGPDYKIRLEQRATISDRMWKSVFAGAGAPTRRSTSGMTTSSRGRKSR